jgi:hypothetical protein
MTFNMGFGGSEQVIRQLIAHLPKDQCINEILFIDGEVGASGQQLEAEQGITIHTLERQPGLDWRLALNIRCLIKEGGFTIVHCHQYTPWFYGWLGSLGTSMTLLESMSLAKPCVATAVGGNPEIVTQNETGFLVEAGDSAGLAVKLEVLRTQPLIRQAMEEAANRRFVSSFSMEKMVKAYQAFYEPMGRG